MSGAATAEKGRPGGGLGTGAMFDAIAARYDLLNRILSLGIDRGWRRQTADALFPAAPPNGRNGVDGAATATVLDVATGTADLALDIVARHPTAHVIGVDPSTRMLEVGRQKVERAGLGDHVTLEEGDAQSLQFPDRRFDASCIAFGIRNVPDRSAALREMARVTRPGGRVAVLELGEPQNGLLGPLARFHIRQVVPRLGGLLSGACEYRYLQQSIAAFPPADVFAEMMRGAGLRVLEVRPLTFGVCNLYVGTPTAPAGDVS